MALVAVGRAFELWGGGAWTGWFGYAPLSADAFPGAPFFVRHPGLRLLTWLSFVSIWTAVSFWVFTPGKEAIKPDSKELDADGPDTTGT